MPSLGKLKNFSLLKSKIFARFVNNVKTTKFQNVSRSHAKQRPGNVRKRAAIRPIVVFYSSACLRRLTLHDFIFSMNKL